MYLSTQADNPELSTVKLGHKALTLLGLQSLTLFAVLVCPQVFDLARLARDELHFLATIMGFRYFIFKELRSVPIFTRQIGMYLVECLQVCPALAMQADVDRTSSRIYIHSDTVYPFELICTSLLALGLAPNGFVV